MQNSGPLALSFARSEPVRTDLCTRLRDLDFPYNGISPIPEVQEWVMSRNFFGLPEQHLYRRSDRPVPIPVDEKDHYASRFMPPIQSSWWASQMQWCVAICDAGQAVHGDKVRAIALARAERLIEQFHEFHTVERKRAALPNQFMPLEVHAARSRAWIALHLHVSFDAELEDYFEHCARGTRRVLNTGTHMVAMVTGIDATIVQADWIVYRFTREPFQR